MPVPGTKPKPPGQARHRVTPPHEWVDVPDVPYTGAPTLPKRPGERAWPAWTRRWWRTVSTMPHCSLWSPADWQFAMDTALVAARMHEGDSRAASEVRNREKVLGTTADYRRDLRIRYVSTAKAKATSHAGKPDDASVTAIDAYRSL